MVQKTFSVEDGNLNDIGLKYKRDRPYKDIDLLFQPLPGALDSDGTRQPSDIFRKTDAAAVKQSVKNILLTNKNERLFQPGYGAGLNEILFEANDTESAREVENTIREALRVNEPRVKVLQVDARPKLASRLNPIIRDEQFVLDTTNEMEVLVVFQVLATQEEVELSVTLTRLR